MTNPRGPRSLFAFLLAAASCALSLAYSFRILPGNAPDERAHAEYALTLSETGRLPVKDWPAEPFSYEAKQPPLYYALGAAVIRPLASPLLQVRALRFLSALFNLATLVLLYLLALKLYPQPGQAWGPLALAAFLPMFVFLGGSVSNDSAASFAGAGLLLLAFSFEDIAPSRRPWILGGAVGLALLIKTTTISAAAGAFAALALLERRESKRTIKPLLLAGAIALAIAGWFYARNLYLYHDPSGLGLATNQEGYDPDRYRWDQLGLWWTLYFESFWGRFGQMTQAMPFAAYALAGAATALSTLSWLRAPKALAARPGRPLLLGVFGFAVAINFIFGFFLSYQPQARYCFPALAAWAVLFWDGLAAAFERMSPSVRRGAAVLGGLSLLLLQACAWVSL